MADQTVDAEDLARRNIVAEEASARDIAHLTFDGRITIWSFRMILRDETSALRVQGQFYRVLSPKSARIAYDALNTIIMTIQKFGRKSLGFHSLYNTAISPDENLLLELFNASHNETPELTYQLAANLVGQKHTKFVTQAVKMFKIALNSRNSNSTLINDDAPTVSIH